MNTGETKELDVIWWPIVGTAATCLVNIWPCLDCLEKLKFFHSLHHINLCTYARSIKYR
jgi:hypothetical protein